MLRFVDVSMRDRPAGSSRQPVRSIREELDGAIGSKERKQFVDFVFALWKRLRQEISSGMDRHNRELYAFESMLSSAPGERYRIEQRHEKLTEYFQHFKKNNKIQGD